MSEPIDIRKLADFRATALVKSTSSTAKGLLVIIAVGLIGFAVWKAFIKKPEPSQTQQTTIESPGQVNIDQRQQIIETEKDTFFMGVKLWRIKFGFSLLRQSRQALPTGSEVRADSKTLKPSAGSDVR